MVKGTDLGMVQGMDLGMDLGNGSGYGSRGCIWVWFQILHWA